MPEEVEEAEIIEIVQGLIEVPGVYEGPVEVNIEKEFHCTDIYVTFDADLVLSKVVKQYGGFYDCPPFCKAVAKLIAEQCGLGEGEYDLDRAELGMQGKNYCVFEGFSRNGEDIGHEFFAAQGAVDLSAIEDEKQRKREAEIEAMLTEAQGVSIAKAYMKVRDLVEMTRANLKASLLPSYRAEISLYIGELLGFGRNDFLESDELLHEMKEVQHHLSRKLLARLKENVMGDFHSPDDQILEIRIDDEDKEIKDA